MSFETQVAAVLGLEKTQISPLSEELVRKLYKQAYTHYENEEYRTAAQLFTRLILSNPFVVDFWRGLASAKQMARDYEASLQAWALVALLEEGDPLAHFHAAECLLQMDEREDALKALDLALEHASPNVVEQIQSLKSRLC